MPFEHLKANLDSFGPACASVSFNHPNIYEKDRYFEETNTLGVCLIKENRFLEGVSFYLKCIEIIENWEVEHSLKLAKGMPFGNYAICLIATGQLDCGLAFLIQAFEDDKKFRLPMPLQSQPMYLQFENKYLSGLFSLIAPNVSIAATQRFLSVIEDFDITYRLSFFYLAATACSNFSILKRNNQCIFSRSRIFTTIRDLCILYEELLKLLLKKEKMLCDLLLLGNKISNNFTKYGSAKSAVKFDANLKQIQNLEGISEIERSYLYVYSVRNFTSHNFKLDCQFFFKNLSSILNHLFVLIPPDLAAMAQINHPK